MNSHISDTGTSKCGANETIPRPSDCAFQWPYDPCTGKCYRGYIAYQFDRVMQSRSSLITYGQIYPVLVTFTVVANIFVAIVLSHKRMRSPTNVVLLCMALADLGVALVPFPFIFFYIFLENYRRLSKMRIWWCYIAMYTAEAIPPICHNTAIWLTVLLAAQRFVYIQYPMRAVHVCSIKRVIICAVVILITSIVVSIPKFLDFGEFKLLKWEKFDNATGLQVEHSYQCMFTYSDLLKTIGIDIYYSVYYWVRVVFFVLVPSLLLIVFSALLIRGIRQAHQRRKRMFRDSAQKKEAERSKEKNTVNIMLVIIVIIFLLVNIPQGILLALICFRQVLNFPMNHQTVVLVSNIDNMLILATYPINFAIYCGMSTQFRDTFQELFSRNPRGMFCFRRLRTRTARSLLTRTDQTDHVDMPLVTPNKVHNGEVAENPYADVNL